MQLGLRAQICSDCVAAWHFVFEVACSDDAQDKRVVAIVLLRSFTRQLSTIVCLEDSVLASGIIFDGFIVGHGRMLQMYGFRFVFVALRSQDVLL